MIHLTDAHVNELVDFKSAIPVLEESFRSMAKCGAAVQQRIRTEAGGVKLSTLGAVIPELGFAGAKVYTTIKGKFSFVIVLFSTDDGHPLATFDANALTRIRTAATTALAVRALAKQHVRRLTVFGAGVQGRAHVEALAGALPFEEIQVVGGATAGVYVDSCRDEMARRGIRIAHADARDAVRDADVIVTATRSSVPLFDGNDVAKGAVIAAIGSSLPHTREIDDTLLRRARRIVVELREQARVEAGDLLLAAPDVMDWGATLELGDLLLDPSLGRSHEEEIMVYKGVGIGLQDIALAGLAWQRYQSAQAR